MFCKVCGNQIGEGMTTCTGCGSAVANTPTMDSVVPPTVNASQNFNSANTNSAAQPKYHQQYQQPQYQQPMYQQPAYQSPADIRANLNNNNTTSVLGWIGWFLLCNFLPLIGIIIVICVSKDRSVKNAMIAQLVMGLIGIVLILIITAVVGLSLNDILNNSGRY